MAAMRRLNVVWSRRWRAIVWCGLCLLCLSAVLLRDALPYLLPALSDHRTRRCPPSPVDVDGCASWRPLQVKHPVCACARRLLVLHDACAYMVTSDASGYQAYVRDYFGNSTCSDEATLRGPHQHVVSISLPAVKTKEDLDALNVTVSEIVEVYKGWVVRLYTRVTPETSAGLCSLVCAQHDLDLCDVTRLPLPVLPLVAPREEGSPGWKWGVLGDPLVSAWAARGVGTVVLAREAHALTQFINSDKCWHMMVDHTSHAGDPLGSHLLGGKTSWGGPHLYHLRHRLLQEVHGPKDVDGILVEELLPVMGEDVMTHDSITCSHTSGALPFPSRRPPGHWVGMPRQQLPLRRPSASTQKPQATSQNTQKPLAEAEGGATPDGADEGAPGKRHTDTPDKRRSTGRTTSSLRGRRSSQKASKAKAETSKTEEPKEEKVNEEAGIPVCPVACRPHLHPDWEYC
ncbi:uncharacterized protein LOC122265733 [Penaeus japonicus]|uniref:uncharacterized protein LOC122265733 n=1 Tax=Penaeus japonicus TaxID=27405 RepID=UPI001C70EC1A|nr:uncharacterized protein LOC122265733 [Penaeus japonicus]